MAPSPTPRTAVREPGLERTGRRLGHSASWFLAIAVAIAIPGLVLTLIDTSWSLPFGVAVLLLASIPGVVGLGLLVSGLIARWSARHRSFA